MQVSPETIDLLALPSLPLQKRTLLPAVSCIYFAMDSKGAVQYIGRSVNLQQRWSQHHRQGHIEHVGVERIAWLIVDTPALLPEIEKALINWFSPPPNSYRGPSEPIVRLTATVPELVAEQFKGFCKKQRRSVSAQLTLSMERAMQEAKSDGNK